MQGGQGDNAQADAMFISEGMTCNKNCWKFLCLIVYYCVCKYFHETELIVFVFKYWLEVVCISSKGEDSHQAGVHPLFTLP